MVHISTAVQIVNGDAVVGGQKRSTRPPGLMTFGFGPRKPSKDSATEPIVGRRFGLRLGHFLLALFHEVRSLSDDENDLIAVSDPSHVDSAS